MRPVRIEMSGFSAFRSVTVVDFADADLFAFVGPTGAGKSSVIDAMIFALYGSVPRYGSDRLVHPVVTQGKPEARVRLDFELGGVVHTAVRVVRRTKTGATTKEARLERVDGDDSSTVLAADARGMTDAVVGLLGLDLEQFTKCVVLPQGAFAALLHDTSAKRQDLLIKLLDLGVYEQVGAAARRRVVEADQQVAILDHHLEQLASATPEAVADATTRINAAQRLLQTLDGAADELDALERRRAESDGKLRTLRDRDAALAGIDVPAGIEAVGTDRREAEEALRIAEEREAAAVAAVTAAEHARSELGEAASIDRLLAAHDDVAELTARIEAGNAKVADQEREVTSRRSDSEAADEAVAAAEAALDAARVDHAAADIARHLHDGDDCPVCGNTVAQLPTFDDAALARAEKDRTEAKRSAEAAARSLHEAEKTLTTYRDRLRQFAEQLAARQETLVDAPDPQALRARRAAVTAADDALADARKADADARTAVNAARQRFDAATSAEQRARASYGEARDRVAASAPPAPTDDLVGDWSALADWAAEQQASIAEQRAALEADRAAASSATDRLLDDLRTTASELGLVAPDATLRALRDAGVQAVTRATEQRDLLERQVADASSRRDERARILDQRSVHETLVTELHPKRFEAWLLEEALASLVAGASERLEQLSSGRYAMSIDDKQAFEVIDHSNADERRLARTLSGGETFLASLALALALAERVAELTPSGQSSLEAIFLDEGFGTLDPETLDVVASAIEELGASGRMVGIVSHVRELAERVPTRFEVRRGPDTSTVERVDT